MNPSLNDIDSGPLSPVEEAGRKIHRKGFTLVEILVAIFLFSIIMTTLYTAFNTVFSATAPIEKGSDAYVMAKNCFSIMTSDLMSIYISLPPVWKKPEFDEEEPDLHAVKGESVSLATEPFPRLRFSSLNHIPFSNEVREKGITEIIYYVTQNEDGGFVLRRFDQLYPHKEFEEGRMDPVICEKVRSFEVRYFDEAGEEQEKWDSESEDYEYATPSSIYIRIVIGGENKDQIFETNVKFPLCRKKS